MVILPTRSRKRRATTVRDEAEEFLEETNSIVDTEEALDDDKEYSPDPEVEEDIDEVLEFLEEEEIILKLFKSKNNKKEQSVRDMHELLDQEYQEDESKMVQEDEREVAVGGGRRRGTGTSGEPASSITSRSRSISAEPDVKALRRGGSEENNEEPEDRSTHAKRSRAGHIGANARSAPTTPTPGKLERTENGPKYEIGADLWQRSFAYLYPLQLSAPASVNKSWRSLTYHLPLWQEVCEKAGLALPSDDIEKYGYVKPNYYRLAHENADSICETCHRLCKPSGSYRALPVRLEDEVVPTKVCMCHDCRVDYYIEHPEPFPDNVLPRKDGPYTVTPRMTKGEAARKYMLTSSDIMSLPYEMGRNPYFRTNSPMYLFEEQYVLRLARQVHGGDIGIAAVRADSEYSGRKIPEPQEDVMNARKNLLRSLLHDMGLHLPDSSAICHIYIERGLGDPLEIVKELETVDWFHRCTNYDPSLEKAHLKKVKRRPRITRRRRTRLESETVTIHGLGVEALDRAIQDETMTEAEEQEEDHHKMAALDDWLQHRFEQGNFRSYKLGPEGPDKPPEGVWPLLDRIDIGHKMLEFAAEKVYRAMEKQKQFVRREGLRKFALNKGQVRVMVDTFDPSMSRVSEMAQKKRRRVEGDQDKERLVVEPQLSTLLEHDFGPDWHLKVIEEAKKLAESRLF
ncbi:hypothetical protein BGX28_000436 [Mortierella sp. GBA30]|nr:hypothetical protein BGX28_000436 [Mortierella sp. GBA30]